MIDFNTLADQAATAPEPADVKATLPLTFVLHKLGIETELGPDGHAHAVCPWHADSDPSFDVFGENFDRFGCFPCGVSGDVFDLLQRFGAANFAEAFSHAEAMLAELATSDWDGPRHAPVKEFDKKAAADRISAAYLEAQSDSLTLEDFIRHKGYEFDADWLRATFAVGTEGATIVIPHMDAAKNLVGYKHRTAGSPAMSAPGSHFTALYAEWQLSARTDKRPVLLCEGESDVWAATFAVGDLFDVLGLPTGAGTNPKKFASKLAERTVVLAFDGDAAGRRAVHVWFKALIELKCRVRIVPMPDDTDIAGLPNIADVVGRARAISAYPDDALFEMGGCYNRKAGKDGHTAVSNWTFTPVRELTAEDGTSAYEGTLVPADTDVVLTSHDLASKANLIRWANANGGAWWGSDRDSQVLLAMLQAYGPFLQTGRMTQLAGLHDWHFIAPGVKIGPDYWQYVAPPGDVELARDVNIRPGPWSVEQVHILRDLHVRSVTDPILAWLAAAPLRSVLHSFPYLGVTGSSSTGKSTLTETLLLAFTGTKVTTNLTSTTRYAVSAMAEATNGIPVWFDEYRPGGRADAIITLNQILRDAFDGASSARGGTKDHWAKVTRRPATAPLIVSGEDAFSETSLVQRMVSVALPLEGKDPETLARVRSWSEGHGLPHAYLTWLIDSCQLGRLWRFENYEVGPESLPSRNRIGLGVLDLGWRLLSRFVDEQGGADLGAPDWSLIVGQAAESATHSPIEDAIRWALDEEDAQMGVVGKKNGGVWVRPRNLVNFVTKAGFVLPGGEEAVRRYLTQHYGATPTTISSALLGGQKRALLVDDPDAVSRLLGI